MIFLIKRLILAGSLLIASTGLVLAYSGNHSFGGPAETTTSNGHSYTSDYVSSGTFPYNGHGSYDASKVNLTGIFSVYSEDGVAYNPPEQYCVKTTGSISRRGTGKLQEKVYSDLGCTVFLKTKNYTVKSYSENSIGDFTLVTTDGSGVTYTTSGIHSNTP